jgi:hypothetical protein
VARHPAVLIVVGVLLVLLLIRTVTFLVDAPHG